MGNAWLPVSPKKTLLKMEETRTLFRLTLERD